jgi:transaldolase
VPAPLAIATERLAQQGQSVWLDALRRDWLEDGRLARWVDSGVRGLTSNPAIFRVAFAESPAYAADLASTAAAEPGAPPDDPRACYERLALADIRGACDVLRPVWEASEGLDGWVSHEVDPHRADDAAGTVAEARRLWAAIERPNAMIKIPATAAGLAALRAVVADGIPVNATLIFSPCQHEAVADAYLAGLEARLAAGQPLAGCASVASLFVSRVAGAVAAELAVASQEPRSDPPLEPAAAAELGDAAAVANARAVHRRAERLFSSSRFARLARHGARRQRLLFASTGAKRAEQHPLAYVAPLVLPDTITTLPLETLRALAEVGWPDAVPGQGAGDGADRPSDSATRALAVRGIDLEAVGARLTANGVLSFVSAFEAAMSDLTAGRAEAKA